MPKPAPSSTCYQAYKSVRFEYIASEELNSLLEDFRLMCNDAITTAIAARPGNRFQLIELAYPRLKRYGLHSHYILSACEVAFSVYKNKRRRTVPYIRNSFLKIDNQTYQLNHFLLRTPASPRNFIFLVLRGSAYHSALIDDPAIKKGSVTISQHSVSLALSKALCPSDFHGFMGIDVNEKNVTVSTANGHVDRFEGLGEVIEVKERYREIRSRIQVNLKGDDRLSRKLLAKYGRKERDRTTGRVHVITRRIVEHAKEYKLGIKMERLTGIRRLYEKGKCQCPSLRGRMNGWPFGETQRQIDYKARWEGIPTYFVNPRGTSRKCPECGSRVVPLADRKLYCPKCDRTWDRDVLGSRNILACAVPQDRPSG